MSIAALALVLLLLALWVLLSYVVYCVAVRIGPSFFWNHHPETAITICTFLAAVFYASLGKAETYGSSVERTFQGPPRALWPAAFVERYIPLQPMVARLDHITVVAPSLEAGADFVEAALGVRPGAGRKHPGMATHNLLLALGPDAYLEVIAVDPEAGEIRRPRWFGLDLVVPGAPARLAAWVASTDAIARAATPELGEIESMRREHRTWEMTVTKDGSLPLGGAAPLLIQRASNVNPAASLPPRGLILQTLRVRHPAPHEVAALLARIDLVSPPLVVVEHGKECGLAAEIQTCCGVRQLGEA